MFLTPPASLTLCPGHTVRVRPAYPLPTRCYKCQHYGLSHLACKSKQAVCGRCSHPLSDDHSPRTCSLEPLCFHCKTPDAASSSSCPKYIAKKRILVHHRDRTPLADARRAVVSQMAKTSHTRLARPLLLQSLLSLTVSHPVPLPFLFSRNPPLLCRQRCLPLNWMPLPQQWKGSLPRCLPLVFPQMGFSLPPSSSKLVTLQRFVLVLHLTLMCLCQLLFIGFPSQRLPDVSSGWMVWTMKWCVSL